MQVFDTGISDVKLIQPEVFEDARGFFFESYNQKKLEDTLGRALHFVQDNHSKSSKGVLRGLHFQASPRPQGKLVRVVQGEAFDVAVDLRRSSSTFGKWVGATLSAENKTQLWIPEGFAHGFYVLSETVEFVYKTTEYWVKELDRTIVWNCPEIGIRWPDLGAPILSAKDAVGPNLSQTDSFV